MSTVFLSDWRFWSFVASITAIVLSQLPPIKQLVKKAKLDIELYSRIHINHNVGNPILTAHMIIRNIGGRKVRVKEINLKLEREGQSICTLKAQNYYPDPKTNKGVILTPFSLNPDDEWSNSVSFMKFFGRTEEKAFRKAQKALKENILQKRKGLDDNEIVIADDELVAPFHDLFEQLFIWKDGEYSLTFNVKTENSVSDIKIKSKFIIFESQFDDLSEYKKQYSTGAGIYWDNSEQTGIFIELDNVTSTQE
ncbi:hypothetical protein VT25_01220 [Photobacterium leiognathi subsp. mandapamensis]|nr:hypothetical protein VT25_01220 [Photobacterium leiognathi subsp. mandapamensis]